MAAQAGEGRERLERQLSLLAAERRTAQLATAQEEAVAAAEAREKELNLQRWHAALAAERQTAHAAQEMWHATMAAQRQQAALRGDPAKPTEITPTTDVLPEITPTDVDILEAASASPPGNSTAVEEKPSPSPQKPKVAWGAGAGGARLADANTSRPPAPPLHRRTEDTSFGLIGLSPGGHETASPRTSSGLLCMPLLALVYALRGRGPATVAPAEEACGASGGQGIWDHLGWLQS